MTSPPPTAIETPRRARPARRFHLPSLSALVVILFLLALIHWPRHAHFFQAAQPWHAPAFSLLAATLTLFGLFQLATRTANRRVAWATVVVTALYPVFYEASAAPDARADVATTALVIWGLCFYLPARPAGLEARETQETGGGLWRRLASVVAFALAGLLKETALVVPSALIIWEASRRGRRGLRRAPLVALAFVPALVGALSSWHTGEGASGSASSLSTLLRAPDLWQVLDACGVRAWQGFGHAGLYLLTVAMLLLTCFVKPVSDPSGERGRIDVQVQLSFLIIALGYIVLLSLSSSEAGAGDAREMLPVVLLLILVSVSTVWRRVRYWSALLFAICAAFVLL